MEYIEGQELLEKVLQPGNKISEKSSAEYMLSILRAIAHMHNQGIGHRDIKPANVMITDKDEICYINSH